MQGCFGLQPFPTAAADLRGHSLAELSPRELGNICHGLRAPARTGQRGADTLQLPKERSSAKSQDSFPPRQHSAQNKSQLLRHEGALKCSDL